jgi:ribosomal protein L33
MKKFRIILVALIITLALSSCGTHRYSTAGFDHHRAHRVNTNKYCGSKNGNASFWIGGGILIIGFIVLTNVNYK